MRPIRTLSISGISVNLPARFDNLSDSEVLALPVQLICLEDFVTESGKNAKRLAPIIYKSLSEISKAEIKNETIKNALRNGAMYGIIDGDLAIRFETSEACDILSR